MWKKRYFKLVEINFKVSFYKQQFLNLAQLFVSLNIKVDIEKAKA